MEALPLPERGARAVQAAFEHYQETFKEITRRARQRFEQRDGHGAQADALDRLELYKKIIQGITAEVRALLGAQSQEQATWAQMKAVYSRRIAGRADLELAETFFNSVSRRIFITVGVDPNIEFVDSDFAAPPPRPDQPIFRSYPARGAAPESMAAPKSGAAPKSWPAPLRGATPENGAAGAAPENGAGAAKAAQLQALVKAVLADYACASPYADPEGDAARAAEAIAAALPPGGPAAPLERIEMLRPVFYRNNNAYLVGRLALAGGGLLPLALCLVHGPAGVRLDAALLDQDDVSIVFSFTRSYFHVEIERPHELIDFLKSILPLKRIAELYISIGYNKHGKTELYRDLLSHLARSADRFEIAPGERGMVMLVFSLPSYDMVFKVIKERIDPPKSTTRQEVMERYDLVFKHDRAGRLVDAQEFEFLEFEQSRFDPSLLEELLAAAPNVVRVEAGCVIIQHLYIERRTIPLNLYVRQAPAEAAVAAVIDYGQAIKDLAATNIFPGDVLLKNFGVTRHGRVVFYDYDELCLVTDCKFRRMPLPRSFDDEMEADPWFYVGPLDIFPEEFRTFLGLSGELRQAFEAVHADLFTAEYWRGMQKRHTAGEIVDIFPYPESKRLGG